MDRVLPVLDELVREFQVTVSLDTSKAELMTEGTRLGASMINDVRALQEPGALQAAAVAATESGCEVCIMHMQGEPGFGFGKTTQHNLLLLKNLQRVCELGYPLLAGLSRKRMFGEILANPESHEAFSGDRIHASVAAGQIAVSKGAAVLRVHDVAAHVHAMKVMAAVAAV